MTAELALSALNERRLGSLREALETGRPRALFRMARAAVLCGLGLSVARRRGAPWVDHAGSALYLAAGLAFRLAWVGAGRASADDDAAVARAARRGDERAAAHEHYRSLKPQQASRALNALREALGC
jgi:hypothetical protein